MRNAMLCVLVLLACSCHPLARDGSSGRGGTRTDRQKEVLRIMRRAWVSSSLLLSVQLTEEERRELQRLKDSPSAEPKDPDIPGASWGITGPLTHPAQLPSHIPAFVAMYKESDEVYYFESHPGGHLEGVDGYVVIRGNELVGWFVTAIR